MTSPDLPDLPQQPALRMMRVALHVMFYALLVAGLAAGAHPADLATGVLLGVVYALGRLPALRGRGAPLWAWLAALTVLWVVFALLTPAAGYVAFPLFLIYLHLLPPRWSLPGVAVLTGVVVLAQSTTPGGLTSAKVIGPCVGAVVAVLTAYGYAALYRESRTRQRLIEELVQTRDELSRSQREAGRLAERQRLAREIHDTLAQGLSSIVLLARGAESLLTEGTSATAARERVREISATAAENLTEARRFVADLTPPALDGSSLPQALQRIASGGGQATAATRRAGATGTRPTVEFHLDGDPYPLPVGAEIALLRLTQEALANVRKHAGAQRAAVTLSYLDDQVTLDVFDDGRGFDPALAQSGGGFGLHGMRERITELGGGLTVESAPGEGTAVAVSLPLAALGPRPGEKVVR